MCRSSWSTDSPGGSRRSFSSFTSKTPPLFSPGALDRGLGLRRLAEAGQPQRLTLICSSIPDVQSYGSVSVHDGATQPGGLGPGNAYSFTVQAAAGVRLSLAGMVVPSHDTIWATPVGGVLLNNQATEPTITLWDAGTEVNKARQVSAPTRHPNSPTQIRACAPTTRSNQPAPLLWQPLPGLCSAGASDHLTLTQSAPPRASNPAISRGEGAQGLDPGRCG